jgi:SAM-dependent methyltransferase
MSVRWADAHVRSEVYDVDGFKRGRSSLCAVELDEVGDVRGKSLLHVQCHFGLDTLSWARLGAKATGADFSDKAIATAKALASELDIPAEFVCSDVYSLPEVLDAQFDVVYTSAGVLCWLPDLAKWGKTVAHFVAPGGFFYIREFHPTADMFDYEKPAPTIRWPYFHTPEPMLEIDRGSYGGAAGTGVVKYEWFHSLSDVINALIGAGLRIEFVHEFPFTTYKSHAWLTQGDDGLWRYEAVPNSIPLMFSIRATRA